MLCIYIYIQTQLESVYPHGGLPIGALPSKVVAAKRGEDVSLTHFYHVVPSPGIILFVPFYTPNEIILYHI